MLKNNEPWSIDTVLCETSPFEYDQGDQCLIYYDDLYNLKAALSAAKKDLDKALQLAEINYQDMLREQLAKESASSDRDRLRRALEVFRDFHDQSIPSSGFLSKHGADLMEQKSLYHLAKEALRESLSPKEEKREDLQSIIDLKNAWLENIRDVIFDGDGLIVDEIGLSLCKDVAKMAQDGLDGKQPYETITKDPI